jgi:hypothetical protein
LEDRGWAFIEGDGRSYGQDFVHQSASPSFDYKSNIKVLFRTKQYCFLTLPKAPFTLSTDKMPPMPSAKRLSFEKLSFDDDREALILPPPPGAAYMIDGKNGPIYVTTIPPPQYRDLERQGPRRPPRSPNNRRTHIKGAIATSIITLIILAVVLGFV